MRSFWITRTLRLRIWGSEVRILSGAPFLSMAWLKSQRLFGPQLAAGLQILCSLRSRTRRSLLPPVCVCGQDTGQRACASPEVGLDLGHFSAPGGVDLVRRRSQAVGHGIVSAQTSASTSTGRGSIQRSKPHTAVDITLTREHPHIWLPATFMQRMFRQGRRCPPRETLRGQAISTVLSEIDRFQREDIAWSHLIDIGGHRRDRSRDGERQKAGGCPSAETLDHGAGVFVGSGP